MHQETTKRHKTITNQNDNWDNKWPQDTTKKAQEIAKLFAKVFCVPSHLGVSHVKGLGRVSWTTKVKEKMHHLCEAKLKSAAWPDT